MFADVCNTSIGHNFGLPLSDTNSSVLKDFRSPEFNQNLRKIASFYTWVKYVAENTRRCLNVFIFIFSSYPNLTKSSYLPTLAKQN
jgi:hypothetical protein